MILTAKDIAERWGVSLPTVYKLFRDGRLPGRRLSPKNIRFRLVDVEAYEAASWNTDTSTPSPNTEEYTAYIGETEDDPAVARLVRQMERVLSDDMQNSSSTSTFGGVPIIER